MNLDGYAEKMRRLHELACSRPTLAYLALDLSLIARQAYDLAQGERSFPSIIPQTNKGVSREDGEQLVQLLETGPGTAGIESEPELLKALAQIEANVARCLAIRLMRDYPDLCGIERDL
jgi:hypothetical protein